MILIGGATGAGKSKLGIEVCKKVNGEIISLDSMQIYKYMNIGTAKIMPDEMDGVVHHMIDFIEPTKEFSVSEYKRLAEITAAEIKSRGKVAVYVGGTGLYANAILFPFDFGKAEKNQDLRNELYDLLNKKGNTYLYNKLVEIDKVAADKIHPNNVRRVIRALEINYSKGKDVNRIEGKKINQNIDIYALVNERSKLYEIINNRVEIMREQGLENEVKTLLDMGVTYEHQSMQAIGYKEWNLYSEVEMVYDKIKQHTRNYAKRQITWFKQYDSCIWLDANISISELSDTIAGNYYKNIAKSD